MQVQWPQLPASGHMMEQASIMRYQLLHQACKARNISVLLTGHHAGRQYHKSGTEAALIEFAPLSQQALAALGAG